MYEKTEFEVVGEKIRRIKTRRKNSIPGIPQLGAS
jgi:hypothetical protein